MFKQVKVSDFTKVITGGTPSTNVKEYWDGGNVPWLNSGELNKKYIYASKNFITELGLEKSSTRMMPPETVLIALTGATCGLSALSKIEACANQSVTGILPSKNHSPEYLFHYLRTQRKRILGKAWGNAQPHISQQFVKDLVIPLPSLSDQIQIANILSKAETLIEQRKQSIALLDELLKSSFLEMFGSPMINEKDWEKVSLSKLGSIERGVSKNRPRNSPELLGGKYPLIQTGVVTNSGLFITSYKHTYSELGLKQSKLWKKGTMLITIAANIAQTSILTFDACFPDSIAGFITNEKEANTIYVHFLFSFLQKIIEKNAPQMAQKNINLAFLRSLKVPKPPIELQTQFAQLVEKTEALKEQYKNSLQELENLYGSLSQQAFKGELELKTKGQQTKN